MKAYAKRYDGTGRLVEYDIDAEDHARLPCDVSVNNDPIGYLRLSTGELLHRWILGLAVGDPGIGDHINKNIYDNRRSNLRIVSPSESNYNRKPWNKHGLPTGIVLMPSGRYQSKVTYQYETHYLGTFDTVDEAVEAREKRLAEILRAVEKRVSP